MRKDAVDALPGEQHCRGDDGISNIQADREKDAPIAHAAERGSRRIPEHLSHAPGVPVGLDFDRIVRPDQGRQHEQRAAAEDHSRRNQPGSILAREQHLAPRRREKPEVQRPVAHLPAEEIHEDAQATEEDREPQVEVLKDPREDHPVFFEVEQAADVPALQLAVDEQEPCGPPPVEVRNIAILGPLIDEPGARRRGDRGERLSFAAQLDVELGGVGLLLFASRTGVLHHEARDRTNRSQVHLQE